MTIGKKIFSTFSRVLTIGMVIFVVVFLGVFFQMKHQFETENAKLKSSVLDETKNNYRHLSTKYIYEYTNLFIQEKNTSIRLLSDNLDNLAGSASELYKNHSSYQTGDHYNLMPGVKYSNIQAELSMIYPLEKFLGFFDSAVYSNANIYYCSESGFFLDSNIRLSENKFKDIDLRKRQWYQAAKSSQGSVWSNPYIDSITGKTVITCSKAVYDANGKFMGAIGIDFEDFSFIKRPLSSPSDLNDNSGSRLLSYLVIDKNGNIIMDSESHDTDNASRNTENTQIAKACDLSETDDGIHITTVNDITISYTSLGINDWTICFISDSSFMNSNINTIDNFISDFSKSMDKSLSYKIIIFVVISIAVLAITTMLSIYLSKRLTRSITESLDQLADGIRQMSTLGPYRPIKIQNNTEMSELAEIINVVSLSLHERVNQVAIESARTQQALNNKEISNAIKSTIPAEIIKCPDIDVAGITQPSKNAGGNFYNYFLTNSGKLAFIIGEVENSGVGAALFVSYIKGLMESIAKTALTPSEAMESANLSIFSRDKKNTSVKATIGFLDLKNYQLSYCIAGYLSPIVKSDNNIKKLKNIKTAALGVIETAQYTTCYYNMAPGEVLVLYSSGLMSYNAPLGKAMTEENIMALVKRVPQVSSDELCSFILHDVSAAYETHEPANDVTIGTLRIKKKHFYRKLENNIDALKHYLEELSSFIDINSVKKGYFVLLTIEEILTNIIKHGTKDPSNIEVYLESFNDYCKIVIIDSSFAFDPGSLEQPDISLPAEKRPIGGLGIHLINKIAIKTEYKYENGHNINTFII